MQIDFGAEAGLLHRAGIDNPITKCAVRLTRKVIASARESERERESGRAVICLKLACKPDRSAAGPVA